MQMQMTTIRLSLFISFFFFCFSFVSSSGSGSDSSSGSSFVPPPCSFASLFPPSELFNSSALQSSFLSSVAYWEGQFIQPTKCAHANFKPLGLEPASAITFDGSRLDYHTGLPLYNGSHAFTAASKESLHIVMLALALTGSPAAALFISPNDPAIAVDIALEQLAVKINSYDEFNLNYPGFGGFLPWMRVSPAGLSPTSDFSSSVPSLDNGELFWAVYAVEAILRSQKFSSVIHKPLAKNKFPLADPDSPLFSDSTPLYQRYSAFLDRFITNVFAVFYDGGGRFRTVADIVNVSRTGIPVADNYKTSCAGCYLNDPYEGELLTNMAYLLSDWSSVGDSRESIWEFKRSIGMFQAADLTLPNSGEVVRVCRGFWFSAHEQWKFLYMPYLNSSIARRVFRNGEIARSHWSAENEIPGLYASITGLGHDNYHDLGYFSAEGIAEIAFNPTNNPLEVTPYGSFPLFLISPAHAFVWYQNMINAPAGQNCFGSTEGVNVSGSSISPVVTWDSKVTTLVAMIGGIDSIVQNQMIEDGIFDSFISVVDREWTRVFGSEPLPGEQLDFALPSVEIPHSKNSPAFNSCNKKENRCAC